jgi:hypothetical protein
MTDCICRATGSTSFRAQVRGLLDPKPPLCLRIERCLQNCFVRHLKQELFSHVFLSIQVYQISYMSNTLWNILRIGTQLVNCLICNQQIVVSITFLIVSSLKLDILTRFRTVRLAEQIINWSDYATALMFIVIHQLHVSGNTY